MPVPVLPLVAPMRAQGDALEDTVMPKAALEKGEAELKKLRNMGPMSAEATVVRN